MTEVAGLVVVPGYAEGNVLVKLGDNIGVLGMSFGVTNVENALKD